MSAQPRGRPAVLSEPTARPGGLPVEILESKPYRPMVRPIAWLSLDPRDNDPLVLLTHVAVALDRVSPLPTEVFDALRSAGASVPGSVVPRPGAALSVVPRPLILVLDDVHHLHDGPSLDALMTLVGHVRGADDLAFTEPGARSLLLAAGADLPDDEIAQLARHTEGWAAGLHLAALSRTRTATARPLRGHDESHVAAYLQSEVLAGVPPDDLAFLTGTQVRRTRHPLPFASTLDRRCRPWRNRGREPG